MKQFLSLVALTLAFLISAPTTVLADGQQCKAKTAAGEQCKRNAVAGSSFCAQHKKTNPEPKKATPAATKGTQCKAKTAAGEQCKRNAVAGSSYCAQHAKTQKPAAKPATPAAKPAAKSTTNNKPGQFGQCKAKTQKGERCKRNANSSNGLCWQHAKMQNK